MCNTLLLLANVLLLGNALKLLLVKLLNWVDWLILLYLLHVLHLVYLLHVVHLLYGLLTLQHFVQLLLRLGSGQD